MQETAGTEAPALPGLARNPDGGKDCYAAWPEALEDLLARPGDAEPERLDELRMVWEAAYLVTPYGEPVRLND